MSKITYTNIRSKTKINGLLADFFTLMLGVCKGCPLSMLLYIIAAEMFANFINANKKIKGIQIRDNEIKLVNFADDGTIFLRGITSLNRIQRILKIYEETFSSKINFSKCETL